MMKTSVWALLIVVFPPFTCASYAFDPAPLLRDTTGVMKLMDLRDGKRSIFAVVEDTKDYFRAEIVGREIHDEGSGKYRFDTILTSTHSGSNPFWMKVSSSGVYVEDEGEIYGHGKVPFMIIPLNGKARTTWRNRNIEGEAIVVETTVGATETIKTPSGEYVALKVSYGAAAGSCLIETEPCDGCLACETFWFSPDVGLVAYETPSGGAQHYLIAQGGKDLSLDPRRYETALERFSKKFKRVFK